MEGFYLIVRVYLPKGTLQFCGTQSAEVEGKPSL